MADTVTGEVDPSRVATDGRELFEPVAEAKEVSLEFGIAGDCRTRGYAQYPQRMLVNLPGNALKYTPAQG